MTHPHGAALKMHMFIAAQHALDIGYNLALMVPSALTLMYTPQKRKVGEQPHDPLKWSTQNILLALKRSLRLRQLHRAVAYVGLPHLVEGKIGKGKKVGRRRGVFTGTLHVQPEMCMLRSRATVSASSTAQIGVDLYRSWKLNFEDVEDWIQDWYLAGMV
jgi:hypothetical protein